MSEINFKAIRVRTGAWVDCSPTIRNSEVFNHKDFGVVNSYLIDINTICQFTGAMDCNGFPIYEHDLLRQYDDTGIIYEVVWNQRNTSFSFVNTECPVLYPNTLGSILRNSRLKVVGNKFDKKGGEK